MGYMRSNTPDLSERLMLFSLISLSPDLLNNIPIFATFQNFFQISILSDKKLSEIRNYFWILITRFSRDSNIPRKFQSLMMMMMNYFRGMVDRRKVFSLISSRGDCQRSSPWRISNSPRAGFEPAQKLSSGLLVEWSCAVVPTFKPRRHLTGNVRLIF